MRTIFTIVATVLITSVATATLPLDFSKIRHWTGEGENQAALVIINDAGASDPYAYVWGYRWPKDEPRNGDDMFKDICANSDELVLLTQITGQYGSTVCGIGFGNAEKLLENIYFDFDMAKDFEFINFDYYNTSTLFGQSAAPGDYTPEICRAAIKEAITSGKHFIQHPIDYTAYGYPAYDYDCWKLTDEGLDYGWWNSAWYTGYWSYWTANSGYNEWMYSGSGFTGRQLSDGCMDAWSFTIFDEAKVGGIGEGLAPPEDEALYSYRPANEADEITTVSSNEENTAEYFTLHGVSLGSQRPAPGLYIVKHGSSISKEIIR
ncbi:MAG: hypothetical protein NC301_03870 [Bacteroides sp.]|nr:hypothetical protein [Bacteroides sp.]MCM1378674.1 hypothetical protein [Bacteroides sp.]MCM1444947.1 hypothetical protein [Prevotella sp.]